MALYMSDSQLLLGVGSNALSYSGPKKLFPDLRVPSTRWLRLVIKYCHIANGWAERWGRTFRLFGQASQKKS